MTDPFIFLIGCFVTLIVGSAVVLLMYAASREPRQGVEVTFRNGSWQPRERVAKATTTPRRAPSSARAVRVERS